MTIIKFYKSISHSICFCWRELFSLGEIAFPFVFWRVLLRAGCVTVSSVSLDGYSSPFSKVYYCGRGISVHWGDVNNGTPKIRILLQLQTRLLAPLVGSPPDFSWCASSPNDIVSRSGAFGTVYEGLISTIDDEIYVSIKQLNVNNSIDLPIVYTSFNREIELFGHLLGCPNITRLIL